MTNWADSRYPHSSLANASAYFDLEWYETYAGRYEREQHEREIIERAKAGRIESTRFPLQPIPICRECHSLSGAGQNCYACRQHRWATSSGPTRYTHDEHKR